MIQRFLPILTLALLFVGSISAQTTSDSSQGDSAGGAPAPASTESSALSTMPSILNSPSPILGNGHAEAYDQASAFGRGAGLWISTDALLGWFQPARLPPLVTTSSVGTPRAQAGILGLSTTSALFQGEVNGDVRAGLHIGAGYWFDADHTFGLEFGFSVFESQSALFSEASSGSLILARPFTNAVTGLADSVVVAFPGNASGSIFVRDTSGNFYETHLDLSERICGCDQFRIDGLVGYRFYRYDEGLRIQQLSSPISGAFAAGTRINATDSFVAQNEFNGFDLGFRTEVRAGSWTLDFLTKVATGGIFRDVKIRGNTTTTVPGTPPVNENGGVFALSSNIGNHRSEDWTIFPEFGIQLAWQISSRLEMHIGYSFLFMNDIVRAHDQLNTTVNPGLFPPPTAAAGSPNQPSFKFQIGDEWIQSINLGLEYKF
jgi:hypothetical protein